MKQILAFLFIFFSGYGFGQITLLKDINTSNYSHLYDQSFSGSPHSLTQMNGNLYYSCSSAYGTELWGSDGTEQGTGMIKDIYGGAASSSPEDLIKISNTLYFSANNGSDGIELWKSDGTTAGTVIVEDIYNGNNSSSPSDLVNLNGVLFFSAINDKNGRELWKSDGTATGTVLVLDIKSGRDSSSPRNLFVMDNVLYFFADSKLWRSDGTVLGTIPLINNIGLYDRIEPIGDINGSMYFGLHGDIWKTNGTMTSTVQIVNTDGLFFFLLNNTIFFRNRESQYGSELWKNDGTVTGTAIVKDIYVDTPGTYAFLSSFPSHLINLNDTLYFNAYNGTDFGLWKSDGTEAGTVLVKQGIYTSPSGNNVININGTLYLGTSNDLWKSDGTPDGTVLVKHIPNTIGTPDPSLPAEYSILSNFENVNGLLYFTANIGTNGNELWKSDGTEPGTMLVRDVVKDNRGIGSSSPNNLTEVDGTLYFTAYDSIHGRELWRSDGTEEGTVLVKDILVGSGSSTPNHLTNVNGELYFTASDGEHDIELWRSDGTAGGTVLVMDINNGGDSSDPDYLLNRNGVLYFAANDGLHGFELWKSNGTIAGTMIVSDIIVGEGSSHPRYLTNTQSIFYFTAEDGVNGSELWRSDGTPTGTVMVSDIAPGSASSSPSTLINVNDVLYFKTNSGSADKIGLWRSDGSEAGTVLVKNSDFNNPINANGVLYFMAGSIWKSDGSADSTVLVYPVSNSKYSFPSITEINSVGSFLYFALKVNQYDLSSRTWQYLYYLEKANITGIGASIIKYISSDTEDIDIDALTNVNGTLYFIVNNGTTTSLWRSDGRGCGTIKVTANESVQLQSFVNIGSKLFIIGSIPSSGVELFIHDIQNDLPISDDCQTISFNPILTKTYGDPPFSVSATASSGLPVTFTSSKTSIAAVSNNIVTLHNAGRVSIIASQAGDNYFKAAADVEQDFCVSPPKPVITVSQSNGMSLLMSSSSSGNHWYQDGLELTFEYGQNLSVIAEGLYALQVSIGGCLSELSDELTWTGTEQQNHTSNKSLIIYPTLTTHQVNILLDNQSEQKEITIIEINNVILSKLTTNSSITELDISNYTPGLYVVHVKTNNGYFTGKFFKK